MVAAMSELTRSADLIEQLLGDPELRRRFRADPAGVLTEAGLPRLARGLGVGERALMTLELRESRSSLAGVMVAAAAEGVDLAHLAEHAAPALARDAGQELDRLVSQHHAHPPSHAAPPRHQAPPVKPDLGAPADIPNLAPPAHAPAGLHAAAAASPATAPVPSGSPASGQGAAPSPAQPAQLTFPPGRREHSGGAAPDHGSSGGAPVSAPAPSPAHQPAGAHQPAQGQGQGPSVADAAPTPAAPPPPIPYPGDQATPQQIAAWMGARAQQAGLPPELPVMAALTESGLHNLNYGDRDSVGFFQMRLGIWNEGPYAGYPDHPDLQLQWFIDHAVAARSQAPALADSPSTWGEWVANVEQPAAQYRYRYQLQLATAQDLLHGADLTPTAGAPAPVPVGQAVAEEALRLAGHGAPPGGATLSTGPDSAQLVQLAYARQGIQLPPVAAEQFDVGLPVSERDLHPGDAVFFTQSDKFVDRVGLYVGHGRFVSASHGGGGIRTWSLDDPRFAGQYAGARRFTAAAVGAPRSYARPLPTIKP
jgi:cell wall-associated NlpC family hydrolase